MTRPPNLIRPIKLTTTFPEDVRAKLELYLYSEAEKRVPKGAIQKFLLDRIREFFAVAKGEALDIEPADLPDVGAVMERTQVFIRDGRVLVQFPTSRRGLSMTPFAALQLSSSIIQASKEASK